LTVYAAICLRPCWT